MSSQMNDFVLQQLLTENQKLKNELDNSKKAIKVSEAIQALIDFCEKKNSEPFDVKNYTGDQNPYTQKSKGCF
jgi:hypothetical protein